jgi:hypothetical protein
LNIMAEPSLAKAVRLPFRSTINEMFLFHSLPFHVSRIPQYRIPPSRVVSQRPHRVRRSVYRALFYCLRPTKTNLPPGSPTEPCGERCLFRDPLFTYPSRPPKNESSLQVPIAPIEKHVLFRQPYFICLSKSPVNEPLLQVPQRGSYGERFPFSRASFHISPGVAINKFS